MHQVPDARLLIGINILTVGINRNTITSLINGAEPKLTIAYKIAKVLGVTVYDIWPQE